MTGLPIRNGVGVFSLNGRVIAQVESLTGTLTPAGDDTAELSLRGRVVGRPGYWAAPGVKGELTVFPVRRKQARLGMRGVAILSLEGDRIEFAGRGPVIAHGPYKGQNPLE